MMNWCICITVYCIRILKCTVPMRIKMEEEGATFFEHHMSSAFVSSSRTPKTIRHLVNNTPQNCCVLPCRVTAVFFIFTYAMPMQLQLEEERAEYEAAVTNGPKIPAGSEPDLGMRVRLVRYGCVMDV